MSRVDPLCRRVCRNARTTCILETIRLHSQLPLAFLVPYWDIGPGPEGLCIQGSVILASYATKGGAACPSEGLWYSTGARQTSEISVRSNFGELHEGGLRRINLPRTRVNRGISRLPVSPRDTLSSPFRKRSDPVNQLLKLLSTAAAGALDVWVGIITGVALGLSPP